MAFELYELIIGEIFTVLLGSIRGPKRGVHPPKKQ